MKKINIYITTVFVGLFLLINNNTIAQTEVPPQFPPFLISINVVDSKISLKCEKGCAWQDLTFNLASEKTQWIDATGMVEKSKELPEENTAAPFKISVQKSNGKIKINSLNGTHWDDISLSAIKQLSIQINEFGLIQ